MTSLISKFKPNVQVDDFEHRTECEGKQYAAGLKKAKIAHGVNGYYVVYGHTYLDEITLDRTRIWTPRILNPFHKIERVQEIKTREFEHWIGIYSESSKVFLERFSRSLLENEGLMITGTENVKRLFLPIWEHYQPLIDAANLEFEEIRARVTSPQPN